MGESETFDKNYKESIPLAYVAEWVLGHGEWHIGLFVETDFLEDCTVSWVGTACIQSNA